MFCERWMVCPLGIVVALTSWDFARAGLATENAAAGTYTAGSAVRFAALGESLWPPRGIVPNTTMVDFGTLLRGAPMPKATVLLTNFGSESGDYTTQPFGLAEVISGGAGSIAAGGTADLVVSLKNTPGLLPERTGTVVLNTPPDPDGGTHIAVRATVGMAAAGQEVRAMLPPGTPYKGIGLSVPPGQGALGTHAELLGGTSDGGPVSFKFIKVADNNGQLPQKVGLISDILDLTTDDDPSVEPFVLAMTYDESLLVGLGRDEARIAPAGFIYIGWQNGEKWMNAVDGNVGGTAKFDGMGPVPTFGDDVSAMLGHWGVDINTNTVWAVLNHNSRFAVLPEPATFGLLGLSAIALLARRTRRTA